jgi:hypothetical protein
MRSLVAVLSAVVVTFLSWGLYGPVLHEGQDAMGHSSLRPFICVGVAYFLIAVVVPVVLLFTQGEKGHWGIVGTFWSLAAGAAGAVGALGIIWAFKFRGNPVFVMPLVFGLAPVVNTFVTMGMTHTYRKAGKIFFAAVIVVAVGAAGVLVFGRLPKAEGGGAKTEVDEQADGKIQVTIIDQDGGERKTPWLTTEKLASDYTEEYKAYRQYLRAQPLTFPELGAIFLSIAVTALCWGSYGPVLHKGQMRMAGSRLRPFLCVGLAYFAIAVVVPIVILSGYNEPGQWTIMGTFWSLAAGAAGAIGALGIIVAFNFGGRPIYVMPLVFGGAPVVNTVTTIIHDGTYNLIGAPFYVSLLMVITGAVCVLVFAPRPEKKAEPEKKLKPEKRPEPEKQAYRDPERETKPEEEVKSQGEVVPKEDTKLEGEVESKEDAEPESETGPEKKAESETEADRE